MNQIHLQNKNTVLNYNTFHSQTLLQHQSIQSKALSFLQQVLCKYSHQPVSLVCSNLYCKQNALICLQQSCQCSKIHKKCTYKLLSSILISIYKKQLDYKLKFPLKQKQLEQKTAKIIQTIDNTIDFLSEIKVSLHNYCLNYPLNQIQFSFKSSIQSLDIQKLTGNQFYMINKYYNKINDQIDFWKFQKEIENQFQNIKKTFLQKLSEFSYYNNDLLQPCQGFILNALSYPYKKNPNKHINFRRNLINGGIQKIQWLVIYKDQLSKIPDQLQYLTNLQTLDLSKNILTKIDNMPNLHLLKKLQLSENKICSMKGLQKLKSLNSLNLRKNLISKIQFLKMKKLTVLDLSENKIQQIINLNYLNSLITLNLDNNNIKWLCGLSNLFSLKVLTLQNNPINHILSLKTLKNLQILMLGQNDLKPNSLSLKQLTACISLKQLNLYKRSTSGQISKQNQFILSDLKQLGCKISISNQIGSKVQFNEKKYNSRNRNYGMTYCTSKGTFCEAEKQDRTQKAYL